MFFTGIDKYSRGKGTILVHVGECCIYQPVNSWENKELTNFEITTKSL